MTTDRDPRAWHDRERETLRAEHDALEGRSRVLGLARLVCVVIVLAVLIAVGLTFLPPRTAWVALGSTIAFVALVLVHGRIDRERDRRQAAIAFHDHALSRRGDEQRPDDLATHPYATDIDIMGPSSVFGFVSFVRTRPGVRALSGWLLAAHDPPALDEVHARQEASRSLAPKPALARALWVAGTTIHDRHDNALAFEWWAIAKQPSTVGAPWRVVAWVLPPITITLLVVGNVLRWPWTWTWSGYLVSVLVGLVLRPRIGRVAAAVVANQGGALAFAEAFDAAVAERFEDPLLKRLQADIDAGRLALRALRPSTLALEALQNEVVRLLIAPILLIELHAAIALEGWRSKHGATASAWFNAYGMLEALASIGMVAHDFPAFAWPRITEDIVYEAKDLGHPLIAADVRVCNDVGPLAAGNALVVTGSNMSGKSTLLRSIGVSAAMGLAGAPVCARALTMGRLRLVTSMQVSDSLSEGASRFYAELRRLKVVTEMAARGPGVLFLLDEVLYGTNARERLIGSRATLAWLLEHGALGVVSTHDFGLAALEGPLADHARNVHFEEQVSGDVMSFDYKLRDGVVQSSNALRLMKQLGLPVELEK